MAAKSQKINFVLEICGLGPLATASNHIIFDYSFYTFVPLVYISGEKLQITLNWHKKL